MHIFMTTDYNRRRRRICSIESICKINSSKDKHHWQLSLIPLGRNRLIMICAYYISSCFTDVSNFFSSCPSLSFLVSWRRHFLLHWQGYWILLTPIHQLEALTPERVTSMPLLSHAPTAQHNVSAFRFHSNYQKNFFFKTSVMILARLANSS